MKKYNVQLKSSYEDLTIRDYQKLTKLGDENSLALLAILSDKTEEELSDMPLGIVNELVKEIDFINETIPQVDPTDPITLNGYGWEITQNIEELTAGQFISIVELSKDDKKTTDNLHMILAVVLNKYRVAPWYKFWKKWERIPYSERDTQSIMKDAEMLRNNCPLPYAIAITSFFLSIYAHSQIDIEDYLAKSEKSLMEMKSRLRELESQIP